MKTRKLIQTIKVKGLAKFLPSKQGQLIFVTGSNSGVINLKTGEFIYKVENHKLVTCFGFQAQDRYVAVGSDDCSWSFHDIEKGALVQVKVDSAVTSIQFHPDGLVLAVGLQSGTINVYDIRTREQAMELVGPKSQVSQLVFSNKGFHLAATWKDQDICRVYQLHKDCEYIDIIHQGNPVKSVSFDVYGIYFLTCAGNKTQIFYYRDYANQIASLESHSDCEMFGDDCSKIVSS